HDARRRDQEAATASAAGLAAAVVFFLVATVRRDARCSRLRVRRAFSRADAVFLAEPFAFFALGVSAFAAFVPPWAMATPGFLRSERTGSEAWAPTPSQYCAFSISTLNCASRGCGS